MDNNDTDLTYPSLKNKKTSALGTSAEPELGRWVQTDRKAHEEWGKLAMQSPKSAALLHLLVARMGNKNAIVASQGVLAELMDCSLATVKRALAVLKENQWIEVVQVGSNGTVNAYVINDRVAWGQPRHLIPHLSTFSANVIASAKEQPSGAIENKAPLMKIPVLFRGEIQLPAGEPAEPPVQEALIPNDIPALYHE